MRISHFLISIFMFSLISCVEYKKALIKSGSYNDAIQNAVLDFSNTGGKLYYKDSVFSVSYHDTLYRMSLQEKSNGNSAWTRGSIIEGVVAVGILPRHYRFLLTSDVKIEAKTWLPSRFIEKNGKLFYWHDDSYPLTEEALKIFKKYNIIQDDQGGVIKYVNNPTNDASKEADYFFCPNDLSRYTKIITNKALGFYEPPKPQCNP